MTRTKGRTGVDWLTPPYKEGFCWDHVIVEVLMDIREELRRIRSVVECQNAKDIPKILRSIQSKLPAKGRAARS